MRRVIIAEKPSVAKAIREVVGNDYDITHCVGHLLELAPPDAYDPKLKSWDPSFLPITIQKDQWKLLPKPSLKDQIAIIANKLRGADEVINAGDPDREGQLLVDEVLEYLKWRGPTKRLLINATDPLSISKALKKIEDNEKYRPLMLAARCRQRADWLVGMNLSRAVTRMLSDGAKISIGRVQTPTLALIVRRHKEIAAFKSQTFYTLRANVSLSGGREIGLKHDPNPRILDERVAKEIAQGVVGQSGRLSVQVKAAERLSPLPYDLSTFQRDAESLFGWGAAKSLEMLQASYEAKLTSYPRTDCRYLPAEQKADALRIAKAVAGKLRVPAGLLQHMEPSDRIYDSKKVAEHHGLIPTGMIPGDGTLNDVWRAWALVSINFLASLLPNEQYDETRVLLIVQAGGAERAFGAVGNTQKNASSCWRALADNAVRRPLLGLSMATRGEDDEDERGAAMPNLRDGEAANIVKCTAEKGKTTPPAPYTEASLIADMRSVAKFVSDPVLKAKLKETDGIGTAATQSAIIEVLKERSFIKIEKKKVQPTDLGIEVIDSVPERLADPGLTAAWESALDLIAKGQYSPDLFMDRVDQLVKARIQEVADKRAANVRIRATAQPPAKTAAKSEAGFKRALARKQAR